MLGFLPPVYPLPLESKVNPSGMGTITSPNGEQIPPVLLCEISSVPRVLEPTSGEPHCGIGISQSSRVPGATSQMLSQNPSGTPQVHNTSLVAPSRQGCSAPGISIPSETSQPQVESLVNARNEGINQTTRDTLLQEVNPERGPMTGGMRVVLFGENFPAVPLYVGFGDQWVRAVSYTRYHYPFRIDPEICDRDGTTPVSCDAVSLHQTVQVSWT